MLVLGPLFIAAACTVGPSPAPSLATSGGAIASASASTAPSSSMALGPGGPGRSVDPVVWTPCPRTISPTTPDGTALDLRCGRIPVPVSYDSSQGYLMLSLVQARDAQTPEDAPPLVILSGEPGMTQITQVAAIVSTLPSTVRERHTVVMLDPRGTGGSTGIDCVSKATATAVLGMGADPAAADSASQLRAIARQLTFDCGDTVGPALTRINSTNAANDLDIVRAAIGAQKLSLIASGGGATIGAAYVDRFPGRIAAAVLDSPSDPLSTPEAHAGQVAQAAESLFDDFAAACAQFTGGCPLGPDPREAVHALIGRLANNGVNSGDYVMTGGSVVLALLHLLPNQQLWPELAAAIEALAQGVADPLAKELVAAMGGADLTAALSGAVLYQCNDTVARLSAQSAKSAAEQASAITPIFGPVAVALESLCSAWPAPDNPLNRFAGTGAPPLLVVGAVRSPLHPFAAAQAVASQLSSAVLISWQSAADATYMSSSCVRDAVERYLLDGTVPDRGLLCPP